MSLLTVASQSLPWGEVGVVGLLPLEASVVSCMTSLEPRGSVEPLEWDDSYNDLLDLLNLQSLLERCIHGRLGLLYRIVYKLFFFPEGTFKLRGNSIPNRTSHQLELSVPFAHTNCYYYSFVPHTTSMWNSLSTNIISSSSSYRSFMYQLRNSN